MAETLLEDLRNVKIDPTNLDEELCTHAAKFLYVAEMTAKADAEYEKFKMQVDELEAIADSRVRQMFAEAGKKATERQIEAEIMKNAEVKKARLSLIDKRSKREVLKALKDAWWQRKDLLIRLAIKSRDEMEAIADASVKSSRVS